METLQFARQMGARVYASVSGGKDSQAMVRVLHNNRIPIEGFIHCDLGRAEWPQSMGMCEDLQQRYGRTLYIVKAKYDLIDRMKKRLVQLEGTGKPFWPSKAQRYCTSDMKRDPTDKFFRKCGDKLIISAEGIRAEESDDRKKKSPWSIRTRVSASCYKGMTVEEALQYYSTHRNKRLVLTWYPVFNYTLEEVWATEGMSNKKLAEAREIYQRTSIVPWWWRFHPAYAFGNDRVSCVFCILGSINDLRVGKKHNPDLYVEYVGLEDKGDATFKNGWSLKELSERKSLPVSQNQSCI